MKLTMLITSRPVLVFLSLCIAVLLLPSIAIKWWHTDAKHIEADLNFGRQNMISEMVSQIQFISKLLQPLNSSTQNLARVLATHLYQTNQTSFPHIINKVAPALFQAFLLVPYVSQISYIGLNGLFFAYYIHNNKTLAVFANASFNSNYTWHTQPVDSNTGILQGEPVKTLPINTTGTNWFQQGLRSENVYPSLGIEWKKNDGHHPYSLFLNTASVKRIGVVSLGFSVKTFTDLYNDIDMYGGSLFLSTLDGKVLIEGIPNTYFVIGNDSVISFYLLNSNQKVHHHVGDISCSHKDAMLFPRGRELDFIGTSYKVYCSELEIVGVPMVYALAYPCKVDKYIRESVILLEVMIVLVVIWVFSFVYLMTIAGRQDMHLRNTIIKQMEATQEAERKSLNKSTAFASASHDIRAYLAGITGVIELCIEQVKPCSELGKNLQLINGSTRDLVDLLNSILDTSKTEAGKMQLEEEEFNMAMVLEDMADLYHSVSMKKGVDVILEYPQEESFLKLLNVKGDRGKLKQILSNLLGNAVKFTSHGNITIRAWLKKPCLESRITASNRNRFLNCLSLMFDKSIDTDKDMEAVSVTCQKLNRVEVVFEVDDTGKGIPKEKQKSVFENYVQVKETGVEQGGTGLGLGIVQSLVGLMGGEIGIKDKEVGEKGTCFRFNVFLQEQEIPSTQGDMEAQWDSSTSSDARVQQRLKELKIKTPNASPKLNLLSPASKLDGSLVVLFIRNEERRNVAYRFLSIRGINVSVAEHWENLVSTLKKIKRKVEKLERFKSEISSPSSKDLPSFLVLVIDATAGPFPKLYRIVNELRNSLRGGGFCKVVWLNIPANYRCEDSIFDTSDDIHFLKPFHGSRLYQVLKLLPEYGSTLPLMLSSEHHKLHITPKSYTPPFERRHCQEMELQENESSSSKRLEVVTTSSTMQAQVRKCEKKEENKQQQPLQGKHILIAEDNPVLRMIATATIKKLGATVEECEDGEKAVGLVRDGLQQGKKLGSPYDYILMDCKMAEMDGYEATRHIREEEKRYGVRIPIIALTAHTGSEETSKIIKAGMDAHLSKPLSKEALLETLRYIHNK